MPVPGGTTRKLWNASWPQRQEAVALAVALVFQLDVLARRRVGVPNSSTMTEWSMTRSTGTSGLIVRGSPPSVLHGVAHGGEVDHGRHAGEVLHQHAGRAVGDLALGLPALSSHAAMAWMSPSVTVRPSSLRSRFSSSTFMREGQPRDAGETVLLRLGRLK